MNEDKIHLDFESRSVAPFGRQKGAVTAYQYANHWGTAIWLLRYAFGDGPIKAWNPWSGDPLPADLVEAVERGVILAGHNVSFEWCLWNYILTPYYGAPELPIEQTDDTAARAAIMALPRSLEEACKAMKLPVEKDMEGNRLMQRMAKPRKVHRPTDKLHLDPEIGCPDDSLWNSFVEGALAIPAQYTVSPDRGVVYEWWCDDDRFNRLGAYCDKDVEAERALDHVLVPMDSLNRRDFELVHRCNMRGVGVDTELAHRARAALDVVSNRYNEALFNLTNGAVGSPTEVQNMKNWLAEQGIETDSLDKPSVVQLRQELPDDHPAQQLLEIRQEAGKSSNAKLTRFLELTHDDGRMRENFMFHGAAPGRLSGKGAQLQNLPSRTGLPWQQAEAVVGILLEYPAEAAVEMIELLYGDVPGAISSCLRAHLVAQYRKALYVADYSNIEGRIAAWFGGEQWKIDAFNAFDAGIGPDLYKVAAGGILGVPPSEVSKAIRQALGKPSELALGFGGGVGAFQTMAKNYGVVMADYWHVIQESLEPRIIEKARDHWDLFGKRSGMDLEEWLASEAVKIAWREKHPGIVKCWADCEGAAIRALQNPNKWFTFADGKLAFGSKVIGGVPFLIGRMPSGRRVYKAHAKVKLTEKFGRQKETVTFWEVDSVTRRFVPTTSYGGDLFQTFVQGCAYDLMMHGWSNVEPLGFEVVLSVHDELGAEADDGHSVEQFEAEMADLPPWAAGCPVTAAGYQAKRYRKD